MLDGIPQDTPTPEENVSEEYQEEIVDEIEVDPNTFEEKIEVEEEESEDTEAVEPKRMKPKTQKRIEGLVKKNHEKDRRIEDLIREVESVKQTVGHQMKQQTEQKFNNKIKEIQDSKYKAIEDGDNETVRRLEDQMIQMLQTGNIQEPTNQPQYIPQNQSFQQPQAPAQDSDTAFKQMNPWYGVDKIKTNFAIAESQKVYSDPIWSYRTESEKLQEVSRRVSDSFKKNPYQDQSPTDGVTYQRAPSNTVTVKKSDLAFVKNMHPELEGKELIKRTHEYKKNIRSTQNA